MESTWTEYALLWADVTEFSWAMEVREQEMSTRTLAWVARCVDGWLPEFGGLFLQHAGDAVLLAFSDARKALQSAWRLQQDWADLAPVLPRPRSHELRIALHWGRIMQGEHGYVAHSLNQLARLAQQVQAGQIWCSQDYLVHLPVSERGAYEDLSWMHFRHLDHALRVFRAPQPFDPPLSPEGPPDLPVIKLLVQSTPDDEGDEWVENSLLALQRIPGLSASKLSGPRVLDAARAAQVLRGARADFLLTRLARPPAPPKIELLAAPWALKIHAWHESGDASAPLRTNKMVREVQEAVWAHGVATAKCQPESALSHGLLQGAALQMMHAGDLHDFNRAGELLTTWCQRFKRHAQPHVWRSLWHIMQHTRGLGRVNSELALDHAYAALELEPEHAHARATLGFAKAHLLGDVDSGLHHLEQAQQLAPHLHWAHLYRSVLCCLSNQSGQAMEEAQLALKHAPQDALRGYTLGLAGHAAVYNHQPAQAVTWLESSWRQHRHYSPTVRMLVVAHQMQGQRQLAGFYLRELLSLEPDLTARSYLARNRAGHARRAEMAHWLMEAGLPMK